VLIGVHSLPASFEVGEDPASVFSSGLLLLVAT